MSMPANTKTPRAASRGVACRSAVADKGGEPLGPPPGPQQSSLGSTTGREPAAGPRCHPPCSLSYTLPLGPPPGPQTSSPESTTGPWQAHGQQQSPPAHLPTARPQHPPPPHPRRCRCQKQLPAGCLAPRPPRQRPAPVLLQGLLVKTAHNPVIEQSPSGQGCSCS
jgi:hypothetical protein